MLDFSLFAAVYRRLATRRRLLFGATVLLLGLSIWGFTRIEMQENVAALLPDDGSVSARDFELLQQSPLSRKLVLTVTAPPSSDSAALVAVVDRLAAALDPDLFSRVVTGPAGPGQQQLLPLLLDNLPNLLGPADLAVLAELTAPPELARRLEAGYARLFGPEGWLLKDLLRRDPLGLRELALAKFQTLNLIPNAQLSDNHFLSSDGHNALLLADTPVAITDVAGAQALEQAFAAARAATLPEGWQAGLLSGHRYTLANASAIKQDLWLILSCASLAILALFLVFLRSWRALFVFSVPLAVLSLAAVAVATIYRPVSAITIGFGAVLLGIAVDFALHVYFALRAAPDDPAGELSRVARPILFGGLTTLGAFAVLLLSDLPGQRQLAVFALAGLGAALLVSLLVLPQLVPLDGARAGTGIDAARPPSPRSPWRGRWVLIVWLLLLGFAGWQALGLRFNGELRALSLIPAELVAAEQAVRERWGGMRSQAMVFTEGADLAQLLERNSDLLAWLRQQRPEDPLVSLAGILPGPAQQAANRQAWQAFWQGPQGRQALATLRAEGARLGFAPDAFAPFERLCRELPPALTVDDWRQVGLGPLFDLLLVPDQETLRLVTLVPDTEEIAALFDAAPLPGVQLVSQTRFSQQVSRAIQHDFVSFIGLASLVILALLTLLFRRPLPILQALVPVASGLLVMFGVMGWLGLEFNLFNVVATILVIGLGVDYGIFMVCRQQQGHDPVTARAVLVSGLTTLAGFGALVLARHPAMHSLGVTVLFGIGAAIPAALWVVPALSPGRSR